MCASAKRRDHRSTSPNGCPNPSFEGGCDGARKAPLPLAQRVYEGDQLCLRVSCAVFLRCVPPPLPYLPLSLNTLCAPHLLPAVRRETRSRRTCRYVRRRPRLRILAAFLRHPAHPLPFALKRLCLDCRAHRQRSRTVAEETRVRKKCGARGAQARQARTAAWLSPPFPNLNHLPCAFVCHVFFFSHALLWCPQWGNEN